MESEDGDIRIASFIKTCSQRIAKWVFPLSLDCNKMKVKQA